MRLLVLIGVTAGIALAQQPGQDAQSEFQQKMQQLLQAQRQQAQAMDAINQLRAELDRLRNTYTNSSPNVERARADLARLQALLAEVSARQADLAARDQQLRSAALSDRWWHNSTTAQTLGLTADQQKKMDDVFQQFRLRLIDANANLEKTEVMLDPLMSADPLDQSKVTAQLDRIADARAELEKVNGRLLIGLREQLTAAQWSRLNLLNPPISGPVSISIPLRVK